MSEDSNASDLAERLRTLQAVNGLTIKEMADRSGLPKRSLENYMNIKGPQRPGVDALIRIANAFGVSIDWIVGRADEPATDQFTKEDYAVFCQSTVLHVLMRVLKAVANDPAKAIDPENFRIMGHEIHDIAAVAMLDFIAIVDLQRGHPTRPKHYFRRSFDTLARTALEVSGTGSIADRIDRKP